MTDARYKGKGHRATPDNPIYVWVRLEAQYVPYLKELLYNRLMKLYKTKVPKELKEKSFCLRITEALNNLRSQYKGDHLTEV